MANDCLFCKIINKEIPANIVYEDENFLAFLDLYPVNFGHTLVIPKKHFENFSEAPENVLCEIMPVIKKIGNAMLKLPGVDSYNIMVNNGKNAGQLIMHLHFHVVPRIAGDGFKHWEGKKYESDEKAQKFVELIKNNIG